LSILKELWIFEVEVVVGNKQKNQFTVYCFTVFTEAIAYYNVPFHDL
jgi:hypothetical protein